MEDAALYAAMILGAGGIVVAIASVVAAFTPTDSDDKAIATVIRFLDVLAINLRNRDPRNPKE